jgi:hypothetical protein
MFELSFDLLALHFSFPTCSVISMEVLEQSPQLYQFFSPRSFTPYSPFSAFFALNGFSFYIAAHPALGEHAIYLRGYDRTQDCTLCFLELENSSTLRQIMNCYIRNFFYLETQIAACRGVKSIYSIDNIKSILSDFCVLKK